MYICYIDESGDGVTLTHQNIHRTTVSFGMAGILIDYQKLTAITNSFIDLKRLYFPNAIPKTSSTKKGDWAKFEVKGSKLAYLLRAGNRSEKRQTIGFLDKYIELLESNDIRILGRIWPKQVGVDINELSLYTVSVQKIHTHFQKYISIKNENGLVIADNRSPKQNLTVSHSIHTQRFSYLGNPYPNIIEVPTFGQSENHTGIQLADILISGLLNPIASAVYIGSIAPSNPHVGGAGIELRERYGQKLRNLQFIYKDSQNKPTGGVVVSDRNTHKSSRYLFLT